MTEPAPRQLAAGARRSAALDSRLEIIYRRAAAMVGVDCDLDPVVLAGMVRTASGSLVGHQVDVRGRVSPPIFGPTSGGAARVPDTDGGVLDGDRLTDRALGPFGFRISVWKASRLDGDGDGRRDPQDFDDAALSAAYLLCSAGHPHGRHADVRAGLLDMWRSPAYVHSVLTWQRVISATWEPGNRGNEILAAAYPAPGVAAARP